MKTFKQYNESLRDKMTPKSDEEILKSVEGKSPFGALAIFLHGDEDGPFEIPQIIKDKVKEAKNELDEIFKKYEYSRVSPVHLDKLLKEVTEWVHKYKGNHVNIEESFSELASKLTEYGFTWRHDDFETFYGEETVKLFLLLLKSMALDEVSNNNIDDPSLY